MASAATAAGLAVPAACSAVAASWCAFTGRSQGERLSAEGQADRAAGRHVSRPGSRILSTTSTPSGLRKLQEAERSGRNAIPPTLCGANEASGHAPRSTGGHSCKYGSSRCFHRSGTHSRPSSGSKPHICRGNKVHHRRRSCKRKWREPAAYEVAWPRAGHASGVSNAVAAVLSRDG